MKGFTIHDMECHSKPYTNKRAGSFSDMKNPKKSIAKETFSYCSGEPPDTNDISEEPLKDVQTSTDISASYNNKNIKEEVFEIKQEFDPTTEEYTDAWDFIPDPLNFDINQDTFEHKNQQSSLHSIFSMNPPPADECSHGETASHSNNQHSDASSCQHYSIVNSSRGGVANKHSLLPTRRRFSCEMCCYRKRGKGHLRKLSLVRSRKKYYSCEICIYKIRPISFLRKHMLSHSREKTFSCDICAYRTRWQSNLRRHMLSHTEKTSLSCDKCPDRARLQDKLRNHILTSTRENSTNPLRLTGRHFPDVIPATAKKVGPTRICAVCTKKKDNRGKRIRRESRYYCKDCNVGLCVCPCFREYHTKVDL